MLSHLHQHEDCLALLEPLYNQLEPLDEGVAITICLLMVHMWLEARQPDKVRRCSGKYMHPRYIRRLCHGRLHAPTAFRRTPKNTASEAIRSSACAQCTHRRRRCPVHAAAE